MCLRIRKRLHYRRVQLLPRFAARILELAPRRLFDLPAKLAILYRFDHASDVLVDTLLHLRKLFLQLLDALLLAHHPLRALLGALLLARAMLGRHLLSQAVHLVAAAMSI